jgi:hypothetical protein
MQAIPITSQAITFFIPVLITILNITIMEIDCRAPVEYNLWSPDALKFFRCSSGS